MLDKTLHYEFLRSVKGVMPWPKVATLVFRFLSPPWTNGPNTQHKWKLGIGMRILRALGDAFFRPLTQQNWARDRKITQSCWCLHRFLGLRADVWKMVYTRHVVTQVYIEKMFNKNIEIRFQSAVFHLCQPALVPLLWNDRGPKATASI